MFPKSWPFIATATALLSLSIAGCDRPSDEPRRAELLVKVVDDLHDGVGEARIDVRGLGAGKTAVQLLTDGDGAARVPNLDKGDYQITVLKPGFAPQHLRVAVDGPHVTVVTLTRLEGFLSSRKAGLVRMLPNTSMLRAGERAEASPLAFAPVRANIQVAPDSPLSVAATTYVMGRVEPQAEIVVSSRGPVKAGACEAQLFDPVSLALRAVTSCRADGDGLIAVSTDAKVAALVEDGVVLVALAPIDVIIPDSTAPDPEAPGNSCSGRSSVTPMECKTERTKLNAQPYSLCGIDGKTSISYTETQTMTLNISISAKAGQKIEGSGTVGVEFSTSTANQTALEVNGNQVYDLFWRTEGCAYTTCRWNPYGGWDVCIDGAAQGGCVAPCGVFAPDELGGRWVCSDGNCNNTSLMLAGCQLNNGAFEPVPAPGGCPLYGWTIDCAKADAKVACTVVPQGFKGKTTYHPSCQGIVQPFASDARRDMPCPKPRVRKARRCQCPRQSGATGAAAETTVQSALSTPAAGAGCFIDNTCEFADDGPDTFDNCDEAETGTPMPACCGDGVCDGGAGEDASSCPNDCVSTCGNGVVDPGERCDGALGCPTPRHTCESCQACSCVASQDCFGKCGTQVDDCGQIYQCAPCPVCGNGIVESGERCDGLSGCPTPRHTCEGCQVCSCVASQDCFGKCGTQIDDCGQPYDCGPCAVCGNGVVEAGERCDGLSGCPTPNHTCEGCQYCTCVGTQDCFGKCGPQTDQCGATYDCGSCGPVCGNGQCESGESCSSCSWDCGNCGPVCGDGWCESGESCSSCSWDCGNCGPVCGDGWCDWEESCGSCSWDCGTCGGGGGGDGDGCEWDGQCGSGICYLGWCWLL